MSGRTLRMIHGIESSMAPPTEMNVSSEEIHNLAGYDRSYPLGFSPLNEMGVGGIRGKYGSVEALASGETGSTQTEITETITDIEITVRRISIS